MKSEILQDKKDINVFLSTSNVDEIMTAVKAALPQAQGDSVLWQTRAVRMLAGVVAVLVWLRDKKQVELSIERIRDSLNLIELSKMACPEQFAPPIYRDVPPEVKSGVVEYLAYLAHYPATILETPVSRHEHHPFEGGNYNDIDFHGQTLMQHGYLTQTIEPAFDVLSSLNL